MLDTSFLHINTITLLAATECNLNCKYCSIAASKNKFSPALHNNTIQALQDGTYISNLKKALLRLNQDPHQIDDMQIWGQEPTLVIGYLADHWAEWIHEFPNINHFMYSTNGMDKVEDVLKFIKAIDDNATSPFTLTLQISYDGIYGEEAVRGGSCETILKNYEWLAHELNNICLKYTKVVFQGHGVFSYDLIHTLNSYSDIENYVKSLDDFIERMDRACLNKNISFVNESLQWQTGALNSSIDGINFNTCLDKFDLVSHQISSEYFNRSPGTRLQVVGGAWKSMVDLFDGTNFSTLEDFVSWFINDTTGMIYVSKALHCSSVVQDLKIMYDGTSLLCQNDIFNQHYDKNIIPKTQAEWAHRFHIDHNQHVNLLTDSDENIQQYLLYAQKGRFEGTRCLYHSLCNLMLLLAQCGQIAPTYLDLDKIKLHAFLLLFLDSCYHDGLSESGSIYLRSTSTIRLFCNGVLDSLEVWLRNVALPNHLKNIATSSQITHDDFQQNCLD